MTWTHHWILFYSGTVDRRNPTNHRGCFPNPVNNGIFNHINWLAGFFPSTVCFFPKGGYSTFKQVVYKGRNSTLYIGPISSAGCSSDSMLILRGILLPGEYMTITIFEQWSKAWLFAAYKEVYRTQLCVGLLIDHYKDSLLNKQYNGMSYQTHLQLPTVNFQVLC